MSKQVYRLSGTDRAKFISADEAETLTKARGDDKKWEVIEGATKNQIVKGKFIAGDAPVASKKNGKTKPAKATTKTAAKNGKSAKKGPGTVRGAKGEWNGHTMCEVLRYCGKRGYNADQAIAVADSLGFKAPKRSTVHMQLGYGRREQLPIPSLSKDEKSTIASAAEVTEKPSKKSKKAKVTAE